MVANDACALALDFDCDVVLLMQQPDAAWSR